MFSITWYSFHWVIIPPCFSLPAAYRAWNSSTSANVQWTRSMRHLSQVITCSLYALPSQQATPFHPSGFVCFFFFTIIHLGIQLPTWKLHHTFAAVFGSRNAFYLDRLECHFFSPLQPTLESLGDSPQRHTAQQSSEYITESTSKYVLDEQFNGL